MFCRLRGQVDMTEPAPAVHDLSTPKPAPLTVGISGPLARLARFAVFVAASWAKAGLCTAGGLHFPERLTQVQLPYGTRSMQGCDSNTQTRVVQVTKSSPSATIQVTT